MTVQTLLTRLPSHAVPAVIPCDAIAASALATSTLYSVPDPLVARSDGAESSHMIHMFSVHETGTPLSLNVAQCTTLSIPANMLYLSGLLACCMLLCDCMLAVLLWSLAHALLIGFLLVLHAAGQHPSA